MFEVHDYSIDQKDRHYISFYPAFTFSGVFRNSLVIYICLLMPSVMCHPHDSTLSF